MSYQGGATTIIPAGTMLYDQSPAYAIGELEKVIGRLPDRIKHDYMGEQSRTHGDLTELLISRTPHVITDQVTGLLLKTYISPITNFLLPIRQLGPYESINFRWMEINFDQGLAPQVENEGLARLYTHNKVRRGARAVRRGVAVKVQEGFYLTPEGRAEFAQQIEQLTTIIQRTNEYDAMVTLLQTPLRDNHHANELGGAYNHVYGARDGMSPYDRLILQRNWFSIINKAEDSRGFANLITNLRTTMMKNGVEPDAIVVPPNLVNFYYTSSEDLWNYNSAGPSVSQNRAIAEDPGQDNGIRLQTFQGMKVVDTYVQRMTVGGHEEAGDLLTVPVQIGEFYPMRTDDFMVDSSVLKQFKSKMRNIRIFNEDQGRLVTVTFEDAIKNCLRWENDGSINQAYHDGIENDIFTFKDANNNFKACEQWKDVRKEWLSFESVRNTVTTAISKLSPREKANLDADIEMWRSLMPTGAAVQGQPRDYDATAPTQIGNSQKGTTAYDTEAATLRDQLWARIEAGMRLISSHTIDKQDQRLAGLIKAFIEANYRIGRHFMNQNMLSIDPSERVLLATFLYSAIHRDNLVRLHKAEIYLPFDFTLARPWMTYLSSTIMMMRAGRETGEIIVGQQRFEMDSQVADRMIYANYFYYGKAVVYKDRNVIVAPNVFIQSYVKGNNTAFVTIDDIGEIHENSGLVHRTNSILSFLTKANDDTTKSNILDVRGLNTMLDIPGYSQGEKHYATSDYYSSLLNLDPRYLQDPVSDYLDYEDLNMNPNSTCFLGHTENYLGQVIHTNTGHLGPVTHDQVNLSRQPGHYAAVRSNNIGRSVI